MEPITLATSLATIVGLMGTYRSERRANESADLDDFLRWLSDHGFQELTAELERNTQLSVSIRALLRERTDVLLAQLGRLDQMLSALAAHVEVLGPLAQAVRPEEQLSDQAVSVLQQLESKESKGFLVSEALNRPPILLSLDGEGQIDYQEHRFLEDDLQTLVGLGLLRLDYNSQGGSLYLATRAGSRFLQSVKAEF
ncbi:MULTISPECIES: hypothetical protein [unclassified Thioalkalivibrio]|uniref:hypothetical protein n=1 Tax=unclassified Thioalkalivibrio TaxID=2621013 RepID=UPI0003652800|nr:MULTISPECIES: hypothetical protein [unclassified Thioalkalivibrio]